MKKSVQRLVRIAAAAALIGAVFTGCSKKESAPTAPLTLLDQIKARGELIVGTASGYPPYEFVDVKSPTQEVIGVDIALAQSIADELGVKLRVIDMSFSALLSSIPARKIDLAIAGINPTDERKQAVDFSDVYLYAEQKLMIRKDDASRLSKIEDFYGKPVAAEKGSSQEALARAELTNEQIVALDRIPDCIMELLSGKVAGIVVEDTVAQQYILTNERLGFSAAVFNNKVKNSAIALEKGNGDLIALINQVIAARNGDGSMARWIQEYSLKSVENAR
jgi:polar amino acid transport system substrate-binding protein